MGINIIVLKLIIFVIPGSYYTLRYSFGSAFGPFPIIWIYKFLYWLSSASILSFILEIICIFIYSNTRENQIGSVNLLYEIVLLQTLALIIAIPFNLLLNFFNLYFLNFYSSGVWISLVSFVV